MTDAAQAGSTMESVGEAVGGALAGIPPAIGGFFSGVGTGAGVHGFLDWAALVLGIALLLSVIRGVRRGRVVGPVIRGILGVTLMGWAVT